MEGHRAHDRQVFHLVLIKPSHYDDDGYPIQWLRAASPTTSLACLNGLAKDASDHDLLGPGVDIRVCTYDETTQAVRPKRIIRMIRKAGGRALIGMVGVQSNQFPRAVDLARAFRAAGLPVCIGGFHVSGCLAMLPEMTAELGEAQRLGIALFAGEAEQGRLVALMRDAWAGTLRPVYNYLDDLPPLEGEPVPILPARHVRSVGGSASFDLGRGCPYQCSFCTIINVQGRKSRSRGPDDLERVVRANYAQGINRFFITDDNFGRNRDWEALFDRLIELRVDQGMDLGFSMQVDTLCHRIPNFLEKAKAAGALRVFIGLENINPDNLLATKKHQNKITEYRAMLQKCRDHGIITSAGYIIGFPGDTRDSVVRDIEIIKRELPLDILEPFIWTPLPGSEDHRKLWLDGVGMDADLNKYDTNHRVIGHKRMSGPEWDDAYRAAWESFYSLDHIRTILRRAAASPFERPAAMLPELLFFKLMPIIEGVHPLDGGVFRRRSRRDRRHGMKLESRLAFYPRRAAEIAGKAWRYGSTYRRLKAVLREVLADPDPRRYQDLAIRPQRDEEFDDLDLYHATAGGAAALARKRRDDALRAKSGQGVGA